MKRYKICISLNVNDHILLSVFCTFHNLSLCLFFMFVPSDKVMAAGQRTALGIRIMVTATTALMSPKTSWIFQITPPRRQSDNLFMKASQNPPLTLHILALQPLPVDLAPQVACTNTARLRLLVERGVSRVCPVWKS